MNRNRLIALSTALSLTVGAWGVHAFSGAGWEGFKQDEPQPVRLKATTLYMTKNVKSGAQAPLAKGERGLFVVQLRGPVTEALKSALTRAGAEVGDYLPEYSFLVRMGEETKVAVAKLGFVRGVARYLPAYKQDPALALGGTGRAAAVRVTTFNQSTKSGLGTLAALGLKPVALGAGTVTTMATPAQVTALAQREDVVYVEPVKENVLFNDKAAGIMNVPTLWSNGLDGAGQVVAVADTGLDTGRNDQSLHPDFKGQVKQLFALGRPNDSSDSHGHGTHVAGSVLGTGSGSNGQTRGTAPGAKLVFQAVGDANGGLSGIPDDLAILFRQGYQAGARIHTNSWGVPASAGGSGVYDGQSAAADKFMWENPDYAILFAAGNDGDHDRDGQTNYGTVSTPSTAKNVITVGASENVRPDKGKHADNANDVASFSSRGATKDGRIKPDIVAPGTWILSAKSSKAPEKNFWAGYNDKYAYMGGTSMATPLTAGTVALVRQYYTDKAGITPRASLLKATLINGAVSMGGNWSIKDQGWGRVDMKNALYPDGGRSFKFVNEEKALATGEGQTYSYTVKEGAPFKVTLVWTDYPASAAADKALVNDLDLTVTGPDGKALVGNHMVGTGPDRTNNVENVVVSAPKVGTYTVTVKAHNVPQGPQRFALIASGLVGGGTTEPTPPPQDPNPKPNPPAEDREAPTVSVTAPQGGTVSGNVEVTAEAKDNNGVSKVEFYANGVWVGVANAAPYTVTWNTTSVKDGTYSLVANAYDAAGNIGKSAPLSVTVRNTPQVGQPMKTVFTDAVGPYGTGKRYYVDLPASGKMKLDLSILRGWAAIRAYVYDSSGKLIGQGTGDNGGVELNSVPAGTYTIVAYYMGGWADYALAVHHTAGARTVTTALTGSLSANGTRYQAVPVTVGLTGALNAAVTVTDGRADLDLYLVDGRGQIVSQAISPNLNPETLSFRAAPGQYMLYVVADSGRSSFSLTVSYPK